MVSIVSFDIFPMTEHIDFGFTETKYWSPAFEWLSYESVNFIENMNSIMLYIWICVIYLIIVGLIKLLWRQRKFQCKTKICKKLCHPIYAWFIVLGFLEGSFFELMVCISISMRSFSVFRYLVRIDHFSIACHMLIFLVVTLFVIFVAYFTIFRMPKL